MRRARSRSNSESATVSLRVKRGAGLYFASIAIEFVGIVLGAAGYGLGAHRLGGLAVVLCAVAMLLGYLINQEVGR